MTKSMQRLKDKLSPFIPKPLHFIYRCLHKPVETLSLIDFLMERQTGLSFIQRLQFIKKICLISTYVECAHTHAEILIFIKSIFSIPPEVQGCLIEAGCYKGGGTAKLSLVAKITDRKLFVFDSFQGIPKHNESHTSNIFGAEAEFPEGSWRGGLPEVQEAVAKYGEPSVVEYRRGWFEDTMPEFKEKAAAVFLDVDLASSTRTCLRYLYPLLSSKGVLFSHDGHLPLVIKVYGDNAFWEKEIGCLKPEITGLGIRKLISLRKP